MTKRAILLLSAILLVLSIPASAQEKPDAPGCKDDPLFPTRMPKYRIERCEHKAFDAYAFFTVKPPRKRVEGDFTFITYVVDKREDEASALEVIRNYENALRKIGAKIEGIDPNVKWWVNGTLTVNGRKTWAEAEKGNGKIWVRIIRETEMAQTIVADAAALASDLKATGHVAVQGIYFDTGKADLKPESAQAVGEVARMFKADPSLKAYVVGHTDTVGGVDANLKLSASRAEAVVQALVAQGVAAARLRPFGNGPFAPVASNATDEGKALNRRVELVLQ
jgi:outer membrane protein OmpA-like peptidoglycan-associated protein